MRGKPDISGTSSPIYECAATLAVMGVTVLGDGFGSAKERTTDEIRPFHSKPLRSMMSVIAITTPISHKSVSGH